MYKTEGNDYLKAADYANAVVKYTEAIRLDGRNHVYVQPQGCLGCSFDALRLPFPTHHIGCDPFVFPESS